MKNILFFLVLILISCNNKMQNNNQIEDKELAIKPLSPFFYEFTGKNNMLNRIDYFYLEGDFEYNTAYFNKLQKLIDDHKKNIENKYNLYSIYIYKKTEELNSTYNKTREFLDGKNNDLILYNRYIDNKTDILYYIKNSDVIYDGIEKKKVNFEFEQ
tara:strand:- start:5908 stop:6378 length:471 start_codon:yes stop_codon:yes gene_type:complete